MVGSIGGPVRNGVRRVGRNQLVRQYRGRRAGLLSGALSRTRGGRSAAVSAAAGGGGAARVLLSAAAARVPAAVMLRAAAARASASSAVAWSQVWLQPRLLRGAAGKMVIQTRYAGISAV